MVELSQIGPRCMRLAGTLSHNLIDDVTMLRAARSLKGVHHELQQVARGYARNEGWTYEAAMLQASLDAMERDLRSVLLEYPSQNGREMRQKLHHAVDQALEAFDILSTPTPAPAQLGA